MTEVSNDSNVDAQKLSSWSNNILFLFSSFINDLRSSNVRSLKEDKGMKSFKILTTILVALFLVGVVDSLKYKKCKNLSPVVGEKDLVLLVKQEDQNCEK